MIHIALWYYVSCVSVLFFYAYSIGYLFNSIFHFFYTIYELHVAIFRRRNNLYETISLAARLCARRPTPLSALSACIHVVLLYQAQYINSRRSQKVNNNIISYIIIIYIYIICLCAPVVYERIVARVSCCNIHIYIHNIFSVTIISYSCVIVVK